MIKIFVDDPAGVEFIVGRKGEPVPAPAILMLSDGSHRSRARRGLGLPWVAAFLLLAAGGGYMASPVSHGAHAARGPGEFAGALPPDLIRPPLPGDPAGTAYMPPPVNAAPQGSGAVTAALQTEPSVTPPPADASHASPPGTAAFGLQP